MEYNFREIEKKWREYWIANNVYKVVEDESKPKYYVLDMFPYPSGAGLHVGHPLGYIASDIYSRYKRLQGFNVLHPMGYDAYGLPAEQYAIQTGQHPEVTTKNNIARYREQMDKIGFSYDWSREVRTCEPIYYKCLTAITITLCKKQCLSLHWKLLLLQMVPKVCRLPAAKSFLLQLPNGMPSRKRKNRLSCLITVLPTWATPWLTGVLNWVPCLPTMR